MNEPSERLTRRKIPTTLLAFEQSKIPALLLSMVLHTVVLLLIAVLWTSPPKGTGAVHGGPVGIAVVVDNGGKESYYLANNSDSSSSSSTSSGGTSGLESLPSEDGSSSSLSNELKGLLPSTNPGGSSAATGDIGLGSGQSQLGEGKATTSGKVPFFGIEGKGTRFVYLLDRSFSMTTNENKPLRRAKDEVINSIKSLSSSNQFQVIFYNDHPHPFGGSNPKLLYGEDRDKELAIRFVRDITGIGGTNHVDAIMAALAMNPDVIFFLTDADDNPGSQKLNRIADRAEKIGVTIHCIQFGTGAASFQSGWITQLAERTGGKFRYVDVTQL